MMEFIIVFWLALIWWKADSILDVLKDIRNELRKVGAEVKKK